MSTHQPAARSNKRTILRGAALAAATLIGIPTAFAVIPSGDVGAGVSANGIVDPVDEANYRCHTKFVSLGLTDAPFDGSFIMDDGRSVVKVGVNFCADGRDAADAIVKNNGVILALSELDVEVNNGTFHGSFDGDSVGINNGEFHGRGGDDVVGSNRGTFRGGAGNDLVAFNAATGTFKGGAADDTVRENEGLFKGESGHDNVDLNVGEFSGGAGDDLVDRNQGLYKGGDGEDGLNINTGRFEGGDNNDFVNRNEAGAEFSGGKGNDVSRLNDGQFKGGNGNDAVQTLGTGGAYDGGGGIDILVNPTESTDIRNVEDLPASIDDVLDLDEAADEVISDGA